MHLELNLLIEDLTGIQQLIKEDAIETLVNQLLDQGIVQPSCSPYAAPVVLVGGNNGTWRFLC